ncbi:hypothetical protein [Mycobacterium paraseoulense]|uniref:Uncharacterized protein n=1 Tax=Mycobacterium paraseoulense TaxID=590652 RepID=A0A1X0I6J6_9MYCO|nr:hypothetical protein [Mycobacterium paraseoulense]MCV7394216.1 hypothetical protein [Mycobacterium paraseoulense]ORB36764.1 hypothetical protein BST39_19945 [Mycobacterium paraseoulense]BBZ73975.1 hypothetical protein MPRS_50680 [Mycobacterium paraseoulense]
MPSTTDGCPSPTDSDVDELAYTFLHSPYAGDTYVDWCLDRRLEGFLRNRGLVRLVEDGDAYDLILNRVMIYIGELRRRS